MYTLYLSETFSCISNRSNSKPFEPKAKEYPPFVFAGLNINKLNTRFFIYQEYHRNNLVPLANQATFEEFKTSYHKALEKN